MASIRDLKKDINYLTYEIISDCNTFMSVNPDKRQDAIKIVEKAVEIRNKLIAKVNNPESAKPSYFREIKVEIIKQADDMFEQLRKLIK